jgi:acyl transferase domain-containing protein
MTFWANVAAGKDTITHFSRAELEARDRASLEFGPDYVAAHGVLDGAELFDAGFFGISTPRSRFSRSAAPAVSGDVPECARGRRIRSGTVFRTDRRFWRMQPEHLSAGQPEREPGVHRRAHGQLSGWRVSGALGNDKDFLCTRVAYKLNLRGPCLTVQAACATSLVAICQACQSLLTYQCDMALAGGVSVTFPQYRGYVNQEGSMGSQDGRCRPFDADATGTVFGHGVGVVLLKRLRKTRLPMATGSTP